MKYFLHLVKAFGNMGQEGQDVKLRTNEKILSYVLSKVPHESATRSVYNLLFDVMAYAAVKALFPGESEELLDDKM